jgi:hypothetical protein
MDRVAKKLAHIALGDRLYSKWSSIRSRNLQVQLLRANGVSASTSRLIERYGTTVLNGPFRGMRYTKEMLLCRLGGPRLLGCYECELHSVLEGLFWQDYESVLDIGSAEGYYAVGISRRFRGTVYAFETEPRERTFCRELAILNGVSDQVIIHDWADDQTLVTHCSGKRCFVICDCEGYEMKLLSASATRALEYSDFLVEIHQETIPGISEHVQTSLARTHTVRKLHARRRVAADVPEVKFLGSEADLALSEMRGTNGDTWMWCQSNVVK